MSVKRYDGSNQVDVGAIKRFDGSNWIDISYLRRWAGTAWIDLWNLINPDDPILIMYSYYSNSSNGTWAYSYTINCNKCKKEIVRFTHNNEYTQTSTGGTHTETWKWGYRTSPTVNAIVYETMDINQYNGLYNPIMTMLNKNGTANTDGKYLYTTKGAFAEEFAKNLASYPYTLYNNIKYYKTNGYTFNLFSGQGYLICPFCD
ncbi:MAG: hypothetical protein KIC94_20350 [Clostridiales bacterium]|nr:hypothetical protein [Clostridiales bacterium]